MNFGVVKFAFRSKRGLLWLLLLLLLSWQSPSVADLDNIDGLVKTPLCEFSNSSNNTAAVLKVSCIGAGLTSVPTGMERYRDTLEEIDLTGNDLTSLSYEDFKRLHKLRVLTLTDNNINDIETGTFQDTSALALLTLRNNSLPSVPDDLFAGVRSGVMNTVDLSLNRLSAVPPALLELSRIDYLKLSSNPLVDLKGAFSNGKLKTVKDLDLSSTSLNYFSAEGSGLSGFEEIDVLFLNGNNFTNVTSSYFKNFPSSIGELRMSFCGIETIQKGTFDSILFGLNTLYLNGNNMAVLKGSPFRNLELKHLYLDNSSISDIRKTAFRFLKIKEGLHLSSNNIPVVHNYEFKNLKIVRSPGREPTIDMTDCGIERIEGSPFVNLSITHLILTNNDLTDEGIGNALRGISNLTVLQLTGNRLQSIPDIGSSSPNLTGLYLTRNNISSIDRQSFKNMTNLRVLNLAVNPLVGFPVNDDTFAETPNLYTLDIEDTRVERLPNLSYLPKLSHLMASYANLTVIPESVCGPVSRLRSLFLNHNRIKELPIMNCELLTDFQVAQNEILEVHMQTLRDMPQVQKLDLSDNNIAHLDHSIFNRSFNMEILRLGGNKLRELPDLSIMRHLYLLNASHNHIQEIKEGTFREQLGMDFLYLNDNNIRTIHSNAFSSGSDLKRLNLSNNYELVKFGLPGGGFTRMVELEMENLWNLHQVPSQYQIPRAIKLRFTYSYHCCIWKDYIMPELSRPDVEDEINDKYFDSSSEEIIPTLSPEVTGCEGLAKIFEEYINSTIFEEANDVFLEMDEKCRVHVLTRTKVNITKIREAVENFRYYYSEWETGELGGYYDSSRRGFDYVIEYVVEVSCQPLENPLTPCENLMDPRFLRVAIWAVWVIALLGNGIVLFVGIASKEKLESSEFLICNLACADLGMGLYLIFLATVDIRTFGSGKFFQSALDWQLGAGCKSAGFIAIFSNELSLFILVILTLERVYTISSVFNQDEVKKKRIAMLLCAASWLVAAVVASLPLFGVNSYNRVAVCLPYLTETWLDKFYIGVILSGNLIGFVIILLSYVYIFTSACYNTPSTHMPQRRKDILVAASKIAILIVTAFLCWAPTAVIGFPALAGLHLVSAAQAKYFLVFVFPLNACVNPFIYAFFTNRFRQKFASIFQRSNDKMTSFPPHHSMRLQRTASAFASDNKQPSRVGSSQSRNTAEELTMKRQSRRSNSLVVQFVENTPSPASGFVPPPGCNLGRRASLPPGFGSTLNSASGGHRTSSRLTSVPHSVLPFTLSSLSNTSSLPDLQEEVDLEDSKSICSYSSMEPKPRPLTSSQESNLRRLSVVREDEGDDSEDGFSIASSLDDFVDASDTVQYVMEEVGTDLDCAIQGGRGRLEESKLQDLASEAEQLTQDLNGIEYAERKIIRRCSLDFTGADVTVHDPIMRRKSSSWSDISSLNEDHSLSPLQNSVFATVEERLNSPWLFATPCSPDSHSTSSHTESRKISFIADHHITGEDSSSFLETRSCGCPSAGTLSEQDKRMHITSSCCQQRIITTSRSDSSSSSSTSSGQYTGIRQDLIISSLHSKPIAGPSSSTHQVPIKHTNHEHPNNSPLLLSSSSSSHHHDNGTNSLTLASVETEL